MKRIVSFLVCLCLVAGVIATPITTFGSQRNTTFEERLAYTLKTLGLFKGVSDTEFELDRAPSRAEAVVMLIRVLGKENDALYANWNHPFDDVPKWADKYVGYAYENGLTKGTSSTKFGMGDADAAMYLTFVLRALGYSDTNGKDFTWNNPYGIALKIGILPTNADIHNFLRADVVLVSYAALNVEINGTKQTLAEKLTKAGVFTKAKFEACYDEDILEKHKNGAAELTPEEISSLCSPAVFYIEVYDREDNIIGSGSGFFIDSGGTAVTNYHVIDGAYSAYIMVTGTNEIYEVDGVYDYNETEDWAILKIDGTDFPYLNIGGGETIASGAPVYAIGSPLGLDNSFSQGNISNTKRVLNNVPYIQITAPISHGSSGGALINKYGEVIGITSAGFEEGQNLNLALPISLISRYSNSEIMKLSSIASSQSDGEDVTAEIRQFYAYELLREWILYNANIDAWGHEGYFENIIDNVDCLVYYDEQNDEICVQGAYYNEDGNLQTYLVLQKVGYDPEVGFGCYIYGYNEPMIEGYGYIYPELFTEDYKHKFTEFYGDKSYMKKSEEMATSLYVASIYFVDVILAEYLAGYGDFSVADFGFINF